MLSCLSFQGTRDKIAFPVEAVNFVENPHKKLCGILKKLMAVIMCTSRNFYLMMLKLTRYLDKSDYVYKKMAYL